MYTCNEIIFSATTQCNLHCPHCFVSRQTQKLSIDDAKSLIDSCLNYKRENCTLEKIGFTGGEPFLYLDFICEVTKYAKEKDLMFDRIMTNGDWWKSEEELKEKLTAVYNSGFDGKIGLSYDIFHAQTKERILTFIQNVYKIWNDYSTVEISVAVERKSSKAENQILKNINEIQCSLQKEFGQIFLPVYKIKQSFTSDNWHKDFTWFKEDYCASTGNIFFVHSNGNIAPCCGFANENKELFIGTIKDSCDTLMNNAETNVMVQNCFTKGLVAVRKEMQKSGVKFHGKTKDTCMFCDFVCKKNTSTSKE
ncbi:MAG: radical SAM protein [Treponema sp.]